MCNGPPCHDCLTLFSGGAEGVDTVFDDAMARFAPFGQCLHWSFAGHRGFSARPQGRVDVPDDVLESLCDPHLRAAAQQLHQSMPSRRNWHVLSLFRRNVFQALWCDAMFCVTWTDPSASYLLRMGGGTKWAAQVYVNRFQPLGVEPADACRLWLYDVNQGTWQSWNCRTQSWTLAEPPLLSANLKFAGIGPVSVSARSAPCTDETPAEGQGETEAVMSEKKKKLVAYHEAGHAILGALMNDYDVVAKISIVPRGPAGGVTIFMPSEERLNSGLYSKEFLENRMCVALGGRIAEEIINGRDNVTTGASNDFQQCTQVAKQMVMTLGMSPEVGQRLLGGQQQGGPFMGRDFMGQGAPPISQQLKQLVDVEVKRIVDEQYQRGTQLLRDNMFLLDELAKMLMDQEKVNGEELMKLINKAAAEGKLVMGNSRMAVAAYTGQVVSKKTKCVHPDKPMMFACADCPRRGFCGSTATTPSEKRDAKRSAIARYGLASDVEPESTGEQVMKKEMAKDMSVPSSVVKSAAVSTLVALCASAAPLPAAADDLPPPQMQPFGAPQMQQPGAPARISGRVTYSRLLEFVDEGSVKRVDFYDLGKTAVALVNVAGREQQLVCDLPGATTGLIEKLTTKNISIEVHQPDKPTLGEEMLGNPFLGVLGDIAFPLLVIGGLLFLRSRGGGGGGIPGFGNQGKAKIMIQPETGVKFENVAGIDEAKEELMEIVDFLKAPERFVKVGAKIPRGVLLTGPPGTGKTLMAKALAGESGVPFIQSSASEFIELFVGVGASRVRDIFKQAKDRLREKAPCIVFIDEIDAIGRQRGAGMGGGNDEREQTLNQMLGDDWAAGPSNSGVIVVAATNRSDILDNALLRPGRFDRRVAVTLPDVKGREQILQVHVKNKKLAEGITLTDIAKRTAGFSGADLENLMNESAILTARRNKKAITMDEINDETRLEK
eukprot:s2090_g3.t1